MLVGRAGELAMGDEALRAASASAGLSAYALLLEALDPQLAAHGPPPGLADHDLAVLATTFPALRSHGSRLAPGPLTPESGVGGPAQPRVQRGARLPVALGGETAPLAADPRALAAAGDRDGDLAGAFVKLGVRTRQALAAALGSAAVVERTQL
jgi:hypothetical protein